MAVSITAFLAYLIGGVPFGYLVARWRGVDILRHGSGNIGATNVARVLGRRLGILVFCLDFAKGALPVLAGLRYAAAVGETPQILGVAAGLAAFLGHLFPIYLRFRGGKGVATGAGVVAVLMPIPALAALAAWVAVLCATRYVSVASLAAALALCVVQLTATPAPLEKENLIITAFSLVAVLLVWVRHRSNLSRLLRGEENRLGDSRMLHAITKTIHVLAMGLWFGSAVFFSFVVGLTLFHTMDTVAALPREERPLWFPVPAAFDQDVQKRTEQGTRAAGVAISPMFGWYFGIQVVCGLLATATALGWSRLEPKARIHRLRFFVLLAALLTVALGWPLEHHVSHLRRTRNEASDAWLTRSAASLTPSASAPSEVESLKQVAYAARVEFGRWHGYSLMLNLFTVLCVTMAMALAAQLPSAPSPALRAGIDKPAIDASRAPSE